MEVMYKIVKSSSTRFEVSTDIYFDMMLVSLYKLNRMTASSRPVIKLSKLSRGSARAQLGGLHTRFGLLGGPSWLLGLSLAELNQAVRLLALG